MTPAISNKNKIEDLQRQIQLLQSSKKIAADTAVPISLGPLNAAFPERSFPVGAVHEFISYEPESVAATNGFIGGLIGRLMKEQRACLWVSMKRTVFPPGLKLFGLQPDRIIFADVSRIKDALWAVEEGLKSDALCAVVGEFSELNFMQSRRLQLAVEHSRVTGFIHRNRPKTENTVACMTRWKIKTIASIPEEGMPGLGQPRWDVHLLKVRNGRPGNWQLEWSDNEFRPLAQPILLIPETPQRKIG